LRANLWSPNSQLQTRITFHPLQRSSWLTSFSRSTLRKIFFCQYFLRVLGIFPWRGQWCQKHPSTKIATLLCRKTKSGFPKTGALRRHPVIPSRRKIFAKTNSVSRFPAERIRDITSDRFLGVKTSAAIYFLINKRRIFQLRSILTHIFHFCNILQPLPQK